MSRVRPHVRQAAMRLRRFYKDPSTIRMMLSYEFGQDEPLPTRQQIADMRLDRRNIGLVRERGIA